MICPTRTPGQVLAVARCIAAELAAEALDPEAELTMADRMVLATLSLAVDAEASRLAGVEPVAGARNTLAEGLALIEAMSMNRKTIDTSRQHVAGVDQSTNPISRADLG